MKFQINHENFGDIFQILKEEMVFNIILLGM